MIQKGNVSWTTKKGDKKKRERIYYIIWLRLEMAWNVLFILLDYIPLKINEADIFVSIEQTHSPHKTSNQT